MLNKLIETVQNIFFEQRFELSESEIQKEGYKTIPIARGEFFLLAENKTDYSTISKIKNLLEYLHINFELAEEEHTKFQLLLKDIENSIALIRTHRFSIDSFIDAFKDESHLSKIVLIYNEEIVFNNGIDKFTIEASIKKLQKVQQFETFLASGEIFAFHESNLTVIMESNTLISSLHKLQIEFKLSWLNSIIHEQYLRHYDILTKLPNQVLFLDRLTQSINKASRAQENAAVLFIDLDRFKEINDSLGHSFGNEVIKEVAQRMKSQIRETDTLARFGGDEFVMVLDGINEPFVVVDIVQKMMKAMQSPIVIEHHSIYMTMSIGISVYPNDGGTANALLKNADAAMHKAKNEGRNTYHFYTEDMTERAFERIVMESSLRDGLNYGDFLLYYQPQVNGETNTLIGMEALIRWKHDSIGIISPAKFIPIAEDTGLIIPLGNWILRTGMKQMVKWYAEGFSPGVLAINLSMKQLQEHDFFTELEMMLIETGCKPQWLELEVTEGHIMKNPEHSILRLKQISNLGIEIAIDDFGTGYSSLSYLKRLPIDKLKIDQSFIKDIPDDEEDSAITKAVIALSKSLNMSVIAEGVETEEQKIFLVENGCKNIQGYFYGKPMPSNEMEDVLSRGLNI